MNQQRNYIIFGGGVEGVRAEYYLSTIVDIKGFVDNYVTGTTGSKSYTIYPPSEYVNDRKNFFIIAVSEEKYSEIKSQLIQAGLSEFDDFVYWKLFGKKIVLLHGNCHMAVVRDMLLTSSSFTKAYGIYPLTLIQNLSCGYETNLLNNIDVLITEDIREDNGFGYEYSVDYLKKHIKSRARMIVIPNLFGMGKAFYPQFEWDLNHPIGRNRNGMFPHGDVFINEQIKLGKSISEIKNEITSGNPFSQQEIRRNYNETINKFKERREQWDVDILDFVLKNYKDKQVFFDQGHPTNFVMKELVTRLLKAMDIKDVIGDVNEMDTHEEFVYPCVSRTLGLKWEQTTIRNSKSAMKLERRMDFDEYLNEYVWWNSEKNDKG